MIGRVLARGTNLAGLLYYLFGRGRSCEHISPHLVAGWRHPAELEPPRCPGGRQDFKMLTGLMEAPLAVLGVRAPAKPVWHCVVRAAPGDPNLGDGAWMRIAEEVMHRTGLSRHGEEDEGVPWVAVHHGDNHIHIVATLARQDRRRPHLHNDYYRIGEALRDIEAEYGLVVVARADRTAAKRPTRAEQEKAAHADRPEPPRVTLQRQVAAAAAGTRSEPEFFAALNKRGLRVRLRYSARNPGEVTGYAVGLRGDVTTAGKQIWYGGGKLAPDLTLPKLRQRWPEPARRGHQQDGQASDARPRLDGHGMTAGPARAALRREVSMCAAAARAERGFFADLERAGLLVRIHYDTGRAAEVTGYAVSLPGMIHQGDGQQVWYGSQTLDGQLSLPALRHRWQAGLPGIPPGPEAFAGADTRDIFGYAATVAADAARQLRASPAAAQSADIAWAAADVLTAAAQATGSPELQQAADGFSRAARASWGRIPPPSPGGAALRTAAYLLAACVPDRSRRTITRLTLISSLAGLARAVAALREAQDRLLQASAARSAAACLTAAASNGPEARDRLVTLDFPTTAAPLRTAAPTSGPRRPGAGPMTRPGRAGPGGPPTRHEYGKDWTYVELSEGPIRDPLTPQAAAAEQREWGDTPAAAPDPARLGRVTTGRGRPSARADRGSAVWGARGSRHLVRRVTAPDITASTASRPRGVCDVTAVDGLASLLATVLAVSERPVRLLLEELAHIEIRFEALSRTDRELTASERRRLDADRGTIAYRRAELLRTRGGIVAAETELIIMPQRLPARTRAVLAGMRIPIGEILVQFGARRLDRCVLCRGGCQDSAGKDVAVESLAVLAIGDTKVGITTERITGAFCRLVTERSSL